MPDTADPIVVFLDTETTRLPEGPAVVWEAALRRRVMTSDWSAIVDERDYVWQLPVDLAAADPYSLDIGRYYERRWSTVGDSDGSWAETPADEQSAKAAAAGYPKAAPPVGETYYVVPDWAMADWADNFARLTHRAHVVGAVGTFDTTRLAPLLRKYHACPGWHYQVHDIEDIAAGYLMAERLRTTSGAMIPDLDPRPPWKSDHLAESLGVAVDENLRHTALGDVDMVARMWDVMTSHPSRDAAR